MNYKVICIIAFFVTLGFSIPCADGQDCNLPEASQLTVKNVYPFIDYQLKTTYWQYLRGANLIYRANVEQTDKFLFLSIYRNIVGTFLSITQWTKGATQVRVATLVRLGDGYADNSGANYAPVNVKPLTLTFRLGNGQYFVDTNQQGQLQVNGEVVSEQTAGGNTDNGNNDDKASQISQKCAILDQWIRQHNWQYLRDAVNVHRSGRVTNERYYCVYNYVNLSGTYFVLASEQFVTGAHRIGTFVRLGDGYAPNTGALYSPVDFVPVVLDFDLTKK